MWTFSSWRFLCLVLCVLVTHVQAQTAIPPTVAAPNGSSIDGCEFLKLTPQHISLSDLTRALQLAIGDAGRLAQLDGQEVVLVSGPPEILKRAVRMMEQVDVPRTQVRLTVYAYELDVSELPTLCAAATARLTAQPIDADGLPLELGTDKSQVVGKPFHVLASALELDQVLELLHESPTAKLIADPQLTVVDRQTSHFQIGTRLPGTQNGQAASDAGLKLTLTPRVLSDSLVQLQVVPEYVSVVGWNDVSAPVFDVRRVEVTTRVACGKAMVIGGLRKHTATEPATTTNNLLKAVGPWFRSASTALHESEIICLVRPEIANVATSPAPISPAVASPTPTVADPQSSKAHVHKQEPLDLVQSGVYQEPARSHQPEQVRPSSYRPSNYARQPAASRPVRNINSSRNSVTQPLPTSMGNRNVAR